MFFACGVAETATWFARNGHPRRRLRTEFIGQEDGSHRQATRDPGDAEAILEAARQGFSAGGYEATSFRNIAEEAGVGPALLVHYFGNKEGLFVAAHQLPIRPSETFAGLEVANTTEASQLIVRAYLHMLDQQETRETILGLARSAVSHERAAARLRGRRHGRSAA